MTRSSATFPTPIHANQVAIGQVEVFGSYRVFSIVHVVLAKSRFFLCGDVVQLELGLEARKKIVPGKKCPVSIFAMLSEPSQPEYQHSRSAI